MKFHDALKMLYENQNGKIIVYPYRHDIKMTLRLNENKVLVCGNSPVVIDSSIFFSECDFIPSESQTYENTQTYQKYLKISESLDDIIKSLDELNDTILREL